MYFLKFERFLDAGAKTDNLTRRGNRRVCAQCVPLSRVCNVEGVGGGREEAAAPAEIHGNSRFIPSVTEHAHIPSTTSQIPTTRVHCRAPPHFLLLLLLLLLLATSRYRNRTHMHIRVFI